MFCNLNFDSVGAIQAKYKAIEKLDMRSDLWRERIEMSECCLTVAFFVERELLRAHARRVGCTCWDARLPSHLGPSS